MQNNDIFPTFFNMKYIVCSHLNRLIEAILMNTYNIPFFNMKKKNTRNYPKSAAMGFFPRDSRTSSKEPW